MAIPLDSSSFARTLTLTNSAELSSAPAKFGAGSLRCNGSGASSATGYGITAPTSTDFDLGAGQFTAECWAYFNTPQTDSAFLGRWSSSATTEQFFLFQSSGSLFFRFQDSGGTMRDTAAAWTPVIGQWYHLAADRDAGGVVRLYVDGVVKASNTFAQAWKAVTQTLQIGFVGGLATTYQINGFLDEVRLSNTARYAGAFTPSASAFADDANTLILVHADDAGNKARVSQAVLEAVRTNLAVKARLSQGVLEVVRQPAPGTVSVSQAVVEVLRNNTLVNLQVSQTVLEVLRTGRVNLQVSQAALEVLRTNGVESSGSRPLTLIIAT